MYTKVYGKEITRKLAKLRKKDPAKFAQVQKKIESIIANPSYRHKFLRYGLKRLNRVHLGHFVLIFEIDHQKEIISFEDYDHHDKVYKEH